MKRINIDYEAILASVIRELHDAPVDFLSISDGVGESLYIEHSLYSYHRTISDVLQIADSMSTERCKIRILEIGAFIGVVSCSLARLGFDVTALDIPEFMNNERLKDRYALDGVTSISANLRDYSIPSESGSFSLIIMCETLEHLNFNPVPVMSEINRLLATGGYLYLSLPNLASLPNRLKLLLGRSIHNPISDFAEQLGRKSNMIAGIHWREYTAFELEDLVTMGGFSIIQHDFFTTHKASIPARVVYSLFPKLRVNQTVVARKVLEATSNFRFCDATR